jgi:hypothetical protein
MIQECTTGATNPQVKKSVTHIGLERIVRNIAREKMILLGITPVIRQLGQRFVIRIGLGITVPCIANQTMIQMDTTFVVRNLAQKYVIQIGMAVIV